MGDWFRLSGRQAAILPSRPVLQRPRFCTPIGYIPLAKVTPLLENIVSGYWRGPLWLGLSTKHARTVKCSLWAPRTAIERVRFRLLPMRRSYADQNFAVNATNNCRPNRS